MTAGRIITVILISVAITSVIVAANFEVHSGVVAGEEAGYINNIQTLGQMPYTTNLTMYIATYNGFKANMTNWENLPYAYVQPGSNVVSQANILLGYTPQSLSGNSSNIYEVYMYSSLFESGINSLFKYIQSHVTYGYMFFWDWFGAVAAITLGMFIVGIMYGIFFDEDVDAYFRHRREIRRRGKVRKERV